MKDGKSIGRTSQTTNLEQGYKVNVMWTPSYKTPWTWSGVAIGSVLQSTLWMETPAPGISGSQPGLREHQS